MLGPQYGIANLEHDLLAEQMRKQGELLAPMKKRLLEAQKTDAALAFPGEDKRSKPGAFKVSSKALNIYKKEMGAGPDKTLFKRTREYVQNIPYNDLPKYVGRREMHDAQDFIAGKPRVAFNKWLSLMQRVDPRLAKYLREVPSNASLIFYLFVMRISGQEMADIMLKRYFATESDHIGAVKAAFAKGKAQEGDEPEEAAEGSHVPGGRAMTHESSVRKELRAILESGDQPVNYGMMSIGQIASEVRKHWKNVNFGAKPYLQAMMGMETIDDDYGMDPGRSIVAYFLSNARQFKGPQAKEIKAELNKRLKGGRK